MVLDLAAPTRVIGYSTTVLVSFGDLTDLDPQHLKALNDAFLQNVLWNASLAEQGVSARVVSMPSWELFRAQPPAYRDEVLPPGVPRLAVEAASPMGWREWADDTVTLDRFGASAPGNVVLEKLGFSAEAVASKARGLLR